MSFVSLHTHSHFSILDGLAKPKQIAKRVSSLGQSACALTDHGSISGAAGFMVACKKQKIKPILGIEAYVTESQATLKDRDNIVSHQIILAKNLKGWKQLIQLVSKSNTPNYFYYKPRIDLDTMKELCNENLISFTGHLGSTLHLRSESMSDMENYVKIMQDIFTPDNFFIEIQSIDSENSPQSKALTKRMRELADYTNARTIATADAHYAKKEDGIDHQVILCSALQTTIKKIKSNPNAPLKCFFNSQQFHIPSEQEVLRTGSTQQEINNTQLIADMCEDYDITGPPRLPHFGCPDGLSEIEYVRHLCRQGWKKKNSDWDTNTYRDRALKELNVIETANLAGYFLIVQDYVNWAKNKGWLLGVARGSAGGSLVSYLLNITNIDPIKYNLIFERFYNAGRNTKDRVSLPDIDVDFPVKKRGEALEYVRTKYGKDRVCQMATFGRLMGRGAFKEVLRVNSVCDFETMNKISKEIPQEQDISDQLEAAKETSIIRWTLYHEPKLLEDWCRLDGDKLTGQYAQWFAQAIRLEGTYKSQGKHAAGVIIAAEPLYKECPMIRDKNGTEPIAGMSMDDLESMGHVKFDFLGLNLLDKLMGINNLLQFGRIIP